MASPEPEWQDKAICKIIGNRFYSNNGPAINFTSDETAPTKLTVTQNQIMSSNFQYDEMKSGIQISSHKEDSLEISNNFIQNNINSAIHIKATTSGFRCSILNNAISSNINGSEVIIFEGEAGATPYVHIAGNYFSHNDLKHSEDLVLIKNAQARIVGNTFYDNTIRYVLNWDSGYDKNKTGVCLNNIFYLNNGYLYTILVKGTGKIIHNNVLLNPVNRFEIATLSSSHVKVPVDARYNWWGHTTSMEILKRIKDKRSAIGLPVVMFQPFLIAPTNFRTGMKFLIKFRTGMNF